MVPVHLFCSCHNPLTTISHNIFHLTSFTYHKYLTPDSLVVILRSSNFPLTLPSSASLQKALMFGVVITKNVISREWKFVSPCSKKWFSDVVIVSAG